MVKHLFINDKNFKICENNGQCKPIHKLSDPISFLLFQSFIVS